MGSFSSRPPPGQIDPQSSAQVAVDDAATFDDLDRIVEEPFVLLLVEERQVFLGLNASNGRLVADDIPNFQRPRADPAHLQILNALDAEDAVLIK